MYEEYKLDVLINMLSSKRPLDPTTVKSIQDSFYMKYNQQSNAIEGNSLTLIETKVLLEDGITTKGKPFKDHLDIINHQNAIYYLQDIIKQKEPLSEKNIKEFNYLLLKGTDYEKQSGIYRTIPVMIQGTEHIPPQPYLIQSKMENLILDYNDNITNCNPSEKIDFIAKLHADFVHIHPFIDGNGRTGRLLMNLELIKNEYPLAIIAFDDRLDYYNALRKADKGDYEEIKKLVRKSVKKSICETLDVVFYNWKEMYKNFLFNEYNTR